LRFYRKRQDESAPIFFQGLGENTCLLLYYLTINKCLVDSKTEKILLLSPGRGALTKTFDRNVFLLTLTLNLSLTLNLILT